MAQVIDVPGYGPTEFPDGMSDEAIVAAIQKNMVKPEKPAERSLFGKVTGALRESAESILEPAATLATGAIAAPISGAAMLAGDIYSGVTGNPRIGEEVGSDVMRALTYQPRSRAGQENLASIGSVFEKSKLAGLPIAGQELGQISRAAGPAMRQVSNLAKEEALIAAQALPDVSGKLQSGAQKLMINALKPTPKQYASGAADVAARQLLERDLSPNSKGVIAINNRIAELQGEIAANIGDSKAVVSKQAVLDRLIAVRDRFMKTANPESDIAAINAAGAGFAEHPLIPGETLPVQLAQDIKQGTYTELRKKFGELGSAQTESQKALARGLKEEIAAVEPSVITLNAEESALLKTLDVVERRQFLEMNKDPIPLTGALRNPAAWAAITADKSAAFKALVARMMYKAGKVMKGDAPVVATPEVAARRIPINKTVYDARNLPQLDAPVIPGSWREGLQPTQRGMLPVMSEDLLPYNAGGAVITPQAGRAPLPQLPPDVSMTPVAPLPRTATTRGLPVFSEDLLPMVDRYTGTDIPIGRVEMGMLTSKETPLPIIPREGRGLLSLADDATIPRQSPQIESVKFQTRMDVMDTPVMRKAVASFIDEAESIKSAISSEPNGFKRSALEARLRGVENRFMAGLKQMGIRSEAEARNLMRKVYETGGETQRGIEKVFTPMRAGAN
jgi:hypothetical protein